MQDISFYFSLGLKHVMDWNAYDHVLFLIALVAVYTFSSWKKVFYLVSSFTIGHTASLIVSYYEIVSFNSHVIECLIPISIGVMCIGNFFISKKPKGGFYLLVTLFFGVIHGFGFASYYKMIAPDNQILSLIGFALGVEVSQLIIVIITLFIAFVLQQFFSVKKRDWILVISALVLGRVIPMILDSCIL